MLEGEQNVERRYLNKIARIVSATDKEAFFALPRLDGTMDYIGFASRDDRFREWVQELFLHYWNEAKSWYPSVKPG